MTSRHGGYIGVPKHKMAAMLAYQDNTVGVEFYSYANAFFCSNKFAQMLATWVKTLYKLFYSCVLSALAFA